MGRPDVTGVSSFEEGLVEDKGEAVAGSDELLGHVALRTYSIVLAYERRNVAR